MAATTMRTMRTTTMMTVAIAIVMGMVADNTHAFKGVSPNEPKAQGGSVPKFAQEFAARASIATANPGMPVKNSEYAVWQSVQEQKQIFEAMVNPTTAMKVMAFYAEPHPIMYSLTFDYNTYNTTCSCLQGSMFFLPEIEQWNVNASVTEISAKENLDGHDCAVFEQKGYVIPGGDDFKAYFELEKGALPSGDLVPRMFTYSFQPDPKDHPEAYVVENKTYTHIEYGTPSADEFKIPVACKNIPSCRIGVEGVTSAKQELKRMLGADW